jgi:hypothetical protein
VNAERRGLIVSSFRERCRRPALDPPAPIPRRLAVADEEYGRHAIRYATVIDERFRAV